MTLAKSEIGPIKVGIVSFQCVKLEIREFFYSIPSLVVTCDIVIGM